jgi:DNA (cytosine-5)-methyltransferase 1
MAKGMTFGSLFAGIGGLDLGLERAGMTCKWQVEIDDYCQRVLAKHWPDVKRYEDVRDVGAHNLEPVDLICGGFPCKQTSIAAAIWNVRRGLTGKDSRFWYEQYRILSETLPEWAIVENPPGIRTWLAQITGSLEGLGYAVSELSITAADVGAVHLRRRLFVLANLDGKRLEVARPTGSPPPESVQRGATAGNPWLSTLPELCRVVDGVSDRLDRRTRIERLGNAVVPQVAEWIGQRIVRYTNTT